MKRSWYIALAGLAFVLLCAGAYAIGASGNSTPESTTYEAGNPQLQLAGTATAAPEANSGKPAQGKVEVSVKVLSRVEVEIPDEGAPTGRANFKASTGIHPGYTGAPTYTVVNR